MMTLSEMLSSAQLEIFHVFLHLFSLGDILEHRYKKTLLGAVE